MIIEKELLVSVFNKVDSCILKTAVELSASVQTVMASLNKYKIKYDKVHNIYRELKDVNPSDFQKEIVFGSLFSRAIIDKRPKSRDAVFFDKGPIKQSNWVRWKHHNMRPFVMSNGLVENTSGIHFSTMSHSYFTSLYDDMDYVYLSAPLGMTSLSIYYIENSKVYSDYVRIDVNGKCKLTRLYEAFSNFFGGNIIINEQSSDKYSIMLFDIQDNREFFDKIREVIPSFMYHKLPTFSTNTKQLLNK